MNRNFFILSFVVLVGIGQARIPEREPYPIKKSLIKTKAFSGLLEEQHKERQDWFHLDSSLDGIEGVSADKAYANFAFDPTTPEVVVAVIDSGVDIHHEDLVGKIWENLGEIGFDSKGLDKRSNGVDDDQNGYVDDLHGWNFIGGYDAEGKPTHVNDETLEMTRIFRNLQSKEQSGQELTSEERELLAQVSSAINEEKRVSTARIRQVEGWIYEFKKVYSTVAEKLSFSFEEIDLQKVEALSEEDEAVRRAKQDFLKLFSDLSPLDSISILREIIAYHTQVVEVYLNPDFDPRAQIVGDDPDDFSDVRYGNNDVVGPDADHGTHVAGIIAANRSNNLGIRGLAEKVKIMVLRTVPNGDERDKDVALSIRYAVDNGAKIINMSFGKGFSPDRARVAEAIAYAVSKNVLLVHAAGNESANNDETEFFPNANLGAERRAETWIEVGASASLRNENMVADFSNFGLRNVDLFAPGVDVESTIPGNKYAVYGGTSMASPVVAGVATLLLQFHESLTAYELKDAITTTGNVYEGLEVKLPGSEDLVLFSNLSRTGSVVNAFSALEKIFEEAVVHP